MRTHPRKNVVTAAVQVNAEEGGINVFFRECSCLEGDAFFCAATVSGWLYLWRSWRNVCGRRI